MIAKLTFYKIESATVEDVEEEAPVEVEPEPAPEPEKPKAAHKEKKKTDLSKPKETVKAANTQIPYTQRLKASPAFQKFQSDY